MNFLAHLFLADPHRELIIGNFIADEIKGNKWNLFEENIANGIKMHRAIDSFTDTHAITSKSRSLIRPQYGKWSGVVMDVFYDHFLAKNWNHFHALPLLDFTHKMYAILEENKSLLPTKTQYLFNYMQKDNWLWHYAQLEGVQFALTGLSKRRALHSGIEKATIELVKYEKQLEEQFMQFMPLLIAEVSPYKIT